MRNIHGGFVVPALLALVALLLIGGGAYVYVQTKQVKQSMIESSTTQQATSTVQNATPQGVKTFTSQKLGIKFNYLASEGDPVVEEGDKVYVGASGKTGQWVQEFSKNPNDDLATAIKKKFLVGISNKDCKVNASHYYGSIDRGYIEIVNFSGTMEDPLFENNPCPAEYRQTNGIRYFLMDENHPNYFFFFSIGQYAISADPVRPDVTWQSTFEVIK